MQHSCALSESLLGVSLKYSRVLKTIHPAGFLPICINEDTLELTYNESTGSVIQAFCRVPVHSNSFNSQDLAAMR